MAKELATSFEKVKDLEEQIVKTTIENNRLELKYTRLEQSAKSLREHGKKLKAQNKILKREVESKKGQSMPVSFVGIECNICMLKRKDVMAFNSCGHMACYKCSSELTDCHLCRKKISRKIKLYF